MMRGLVLMVVAALLSVSVGGMAGAQQFVDVGPTLNIPGSVGAAWGDYDGDGDADLFIAGTAYIGYSGTLLRNNGNFTFADVSASLDLPAVQEEDDGAAWGDYDNDGDIDLLIGSGGAYEKLYRNDGTSFLDVAADAGLTYFRPGRTVAWCDYDADNDLDAFVCYTLSNISALFQNNGDGTFSNVTVSAEMTGLASPSAANGCAWGDYDNDGWADLIIARMDARPLLFHNSGDGTFTEVGLASFATVDSSLGVVWGDYDNDGWLDCYFTSESESRDWLFHNNGDGTFTDVAASAGMAADASLGTGVAWADYDNDGWLDLYVGNLETDNQPFLYHNDRDGTFTNVTATAGVAGSYPNEAAMWADVDLDGRLDLFQAVGEPTARLFRNIGPAGGYLRVSALSDGNGDATDGDPTRDAIGARVELNLDNDDSFPSGRTLIREIDGGSGFCGQNEQVAHFGVGSVPVVTVRVRFPDGSVVTHRSVPVNQQIVIRDVPADRTEEPFDDIPLDFWAFEQVEGCVGAGIVAGYEDGTY